MRILVPYIGVEMPSIVMSDIGRDLGINIDIEHVGRPRLRVAAPDRKGIPHQDYKVRLFPITDDYRKFSWHGRRVNGCCWHGHYRFMNKLYKHFPDMTIRSALAEYNGVDSFNDKYQSTYGKFFADGSCTC